MRIINHVDTVKVQDLRTGTYLKAARGCITPYGPFRSVAVARDHVLSKEPTLWNDIRKLDDEEIAKRVYSRIYARCKRNMGKWKFTLIY